MFAFLVTITTLTLVPGATTLLVLRRALHGGWRAAAPVIAGGSLGVFFHALAAAAGLSMVFQQDARLRGWVATAGALVLAFLGIRALIRAWLPPRAPAADERRVIAKSDRAAFGEGLLTLLLSPESALFYLSAFGRFTDAAQNLWAQALLMGTLHAAVRIGWYSLIAALAGRAMRALSRPVVNRALEALSGATLLALSIAALW